MPKKLLALLLLLSLPALAQAPDAAKPEAKDAKPDAKQAKPPEEKSAVTHHTLTLDGQKLPYTASAGNLLLKDDDGTVKASVFYIAYTLDGAKDPAARPVTFAFNGGPGSASLWIHLGAFGPKRVERTDEGMALPPPGRLVDNDQSILDLTDLVFIDPVSTGFSRPAPGQDPKQFHGVRKDVESVAEFIRLWTTRNQRWASPKFVAGESYGTTRAAGLRDQGKTVGRLDTRFTGTDLDAAGETFEYDPAMAALSGASGSTINDYLRRELNYDTDLVYERQGKVWPWSWDDFENQYVNMGEYLRRAMTQNPDLQVLMASGVFDLATPYFDTLFTKDHLGLPKELRDHVQVELFEAGHMMYIRRADHQKLKGAIGRFIKRAAPVLK